MNEYADFFIPSSSRKRKDIKLLEAGPNPAILYSIIDEGTHYNKYYDKKQRSVRLIFEFPLLMQLFKEGDTDERPTVVSQDYNFLLAETSALKGIVDGFENRVLNKNEYINGWKLGQYLGRIVIVDIVNKPDKKDPSIIYNNIGGVKSLTDHLRNTYNFNWEKVIRHNDVIAFAIDPDFKCFKSETFTKLPNYLQQKIKISEEGKMFANSGGVFATKDDFNGSNNQQQATPPPAQRQPVNNPPASKALLTDDQGRAIEMIKTDFTYEQYKASGWSNEQMVQHGIIKYITVASVPFSPPVSLPSAPAPGPANNIGLGVIDDGMPF